MDFDLSPTWTLILVLIILWDISWKALALWTAAQKNQRVWFITLLLINSVGILPITYLLINNNADKERG